MTTEKVAIDVPAYRKAVRHGIAAAVWIAILTFAEFAVFHFFESSDYLTWMLLPFVIAKGWIILDAFMHIGALWGSDH
jgi:cytochrome c oxidase subunit IV